MWIRQRLRLPLGLPLRFALSLLHRLRHGLQQRQRARQPQPQRLRELLRVSHAPAHANCEWLPQRDAQRLAAAQWLRDGEPHGVCVGLHKRERFGHALTTRHPHALPIVLPGGQRQQQRQSLPLWQRLHLAYRGGGFALRVRHGRPLGDGAAVTVRVRLPGRFAVAHGQRHALAAPHEEPLANCNLKR